MNRIDAWAEPVLSASPSLPESDTLVSSPVTADGLTTRATPLPLDTFMVGLIDVTVVPPPSNPAMSVHAVVSALKLKLPLLCANTDVGASARTKTAMANIQRDFISGSPLGRSPLSGRDATTLLR